MSATFRMDERESAHELKDQPFCQQFRGTTELLRQFLQGTALQRLHNDRTAALWLVLSEVNDSDHVWMPQVRHERHLALRSSDLFRACCLRLQFFDSQRKPRGSFLG